MPKYLTQANQIKNAIAHLSSHPILWLDTEIADWQTPKPRLSLIQASVNPQDTTGNDVYILDVLDQSYLSSYFIDQIMVNLQIKKVFHNANFDIRYLGEQQVKNVTCTLKIAKKITREALKVTDLKLKTLAEQLCHFTLVSNEQATDWGKRPLRFEQLEYATMDVIYLAHVHHYLLDFGRTKMNQFLDTVTDETMKEYYPVLVDSSESTSVILQALSLNHIQIAEQCPRLFYLVYHQGGEERFKSEHESLNKLFNTLSSQLIDVLKQDTRFSQIFNLTPEQLNSEEIAQKIQKLSYEVFFFPYLQTQIKAKSQQATDLYQIWTAITFLIKCWTDFIIDNRYFHPTEALLAKTFIAQNLSVEHQFHLTNQQQSIKGLLNSLVYNWKQKSLLIFRYQANRFSDSLSQELDIVLSSYLLHKHFNIPITSVSYWRLPDTQEVAYSWTQIESILTQLLTQKIPQFHQWLAWKSPNPNPPPATSEQQLCNICPQQNTCQSFFNSHPVPTIPPSSTDKNSPPTVEPILTDTIGQELVSALKAFGVQVEYLGSVVAPSFVRVKLKPAPGVKVVTITNRSDDLQVQLGLDSPPMIQPQAGFISVDIPRKDRQTANFEQYISKSTSEKMTIAIGINLDGKLVEADLADPNTCHFLVAGGTGSGKSEFLRSLLLSLLVRHSPDTLQIALVDPKRVTFPECENMPWLYTPIVKETEEAINLMNDLVIVMEERYKLLEKAQCPDINTYNKSSRSPLSRIVCIFDEYADFMSEKESRIELENSIKRLGAKARAAGIHLIISTQRPEAKVVTPLIRSNLPGRIALRTNSEADSKIILDEPLAAKLLGKGDLLYKMAGKLERLQSLFVKNFSI